ETTSSIVRTSRACRPPRTACDLRRIAAFATMRAYRAVLAPHDDDAPRVERGRRSLARVTRRTNVSIHHTWVQKQWSRGPMVSGSVRAAVRNLGVDDWTAGHDACGRGDGAAGAYPRGLPPPRRRRPGLHRAAGRLGRHRHPTAPSRAGLPIAHRRRRLGPAATEPTGGG